MISKLVAILAFTAAIISAQTTLRLPVTQDFAVANNGYSGAQVSRPDKISFFNNGFQSSVAYFGVDLSPMAMYDSNTIASATLTFVNYTLSRDTSATIPITLLNHGQVFDETTVNLNTQPTSQGTLGTVTFGGAATLEVKSQLKAAQVAGGLFGFRVDPPGGPVTVASHRTNPESVFIQVVYSGTNAPAATTTTAAPAPGTPSTVQSTTTTRAPATQPITAAPIPGAPSTTRAASPTQASGVANNCWTCGAGWVHWFTIPGMAQPGNDPCACVQSTTTTSPTAGPTSTFAPGASVPVGTDQAAGTDQPRSSATKVSAALLCIVPLAIAILL